MKIFQKAGKLTIEGEDGKGDRMGYTLRQFVDDLIRETQRNKLDWKVQDGYGYGHGYYYYTDTRGMRININYIGWGRWVFTKPFCERENDPRRQPVPRGLISCIRQYLKRQKMKDRLRHKNGVLGELGGLFRPRV